MNLPTPAALRWHPGCIACGLNPAGLGLHFEVVDGKARSRFDCGARYQGYRGLLHGGVIATIIDATMTQCLFARGVGAYTAKLEVRYRRPIPIGSEAIVEAWIKEVSHPTYALGAVVLVGQSRSATAKAIFMVPADGVSALLDGTATP